ncbi:MAG: hypothetical protein GQ534_01460 [Candidatus Delongbacteria bacterium]|nr:hypothetical protein [Candidatus Delongbacteria bacterium]
MKRVLSLLIAITIIFIGCTQKKTENNTDSVKSYQLSDTLMTIEKYADMDFELASMLFEKYFDQLKDKKYEEVKNIYDKFLNEKESIYKKYGVTNKQKIAIWGKQNKKELKVYRTEHSEINYYEKYPNFKEANIALYNLARGKYNSEQNKE